MREQSNPRVFHVDTTGLPSWFKPMSPDRVVTPYYTPRAIAEAAHGGVPLMPKLRYGDFRLREIRTRENPWHPAGRVELMVISNSVASFTLRFTGPDEQIQCTSVCKHLRKEAQPRKTVNAKYRGPRLSGDTKSAVVSEKPRNRP